MSEVVSDCEGQCIHYWVCKNKEQYQKIVSKKTVVKIDKEVSDYVEILTEVSLLCKNQQQPRNGQFHGAPKYRRLDKYSYECDTCEHNKVCKNKEGFQAICDSLIDKVKETSFVLYCPYYQRPWKEE